MTKTRLLHVAAAIIHKNEKILIAQRKPDSFLEPNKWEFPGGKIERTEQPEECLIREAKEELNIDITVKQLFMMYTHTYHKNHNHYPIQLLIYLAHWKGGDIQTKDCQDYAWVTTDELSEYDFVEGDKPVLKKLFSRHHIKKNGK